jgi:hypothetical protein
MKEDRLFEYIKGVIGGTVALGAVLFFFGYRALSLRFKMDYGYVGSLTEYYSPFEVMTNVGLGLVPTGLAYAIFALPIAYAISKSLGARVRSATKGVDGVFLWFCFFVVVCVYVWQEQIITFVRHRTELPLGEGLSPLLEMLARHTGAAIQIPLLIIMLLGVMVLYENRFGIGKYLRLVLLTFLVYSVFYEIFTYTGAVERPPKAYAAFVLTNCDTMQVVYIKGTDKGYLVCDTAKNRNRLIHLSTNVVSKVEFDKNTER